MEGYTVEIVITLVKDTKGKYHAIEKSLDVTTGVSAGGYTCDDMDSELYPLVTDEFVESIRAGVEKSVGEV